MPNSQVPGFDYEAALAGCAARRRDALEGLYRAEGARLLGVARRIVGDQALAEDIVHDAFVRIWNQAGSYDPALGSARGWIYSVARHLALNFVRDHARVVANDEQASARIDADTAVQAWREAQASPSWSEHAGRMGPCLEALPPERRNCLLHAYVEGLSHSEIAQRLGTPLGTIKAWITRSLKSLKECLA